MKFFFSGKKFPDALNTAVFTTSYVINNNSIITLISHELDGAWQFMGAEPIINYEEVAKVVGLGEIIKIDKTVLKVADLPMGYQATRLNKKDDWKIVKIEYNADEIAEMGFYCSSCGVFHKEVPMAYGADAPVQYNQIPEEEREERCSINADTCIIDNEEYFIKGTLLIAVDNKAENFSWNVWVKISSDNYQKMAEMWEDENRFLEQPYGGEIASELEVYPNTLKIPVKIHTQKIGYRPKIEVIESSHPLFLEQENGITQERVIEFAKIILYAH